MVIIEEKHLKAADLKEGELKTEIAIMLFQQERLSLRKAAELAGVHWLEFMKLLNRREISLHYDESLL
jgi:predicted HTH domain antitoxin